MPRDKINVRQQLFGFPDEDLKTSLHDEIVLWLKKNELLISQKILGWDDGLNIERIQTIEARVAKDLKDFQHVMRLDLNANLEQLKHEHCWAKITIEKKVKKQCEYLELIESWNGLESPPASQFFVESKIEVPIIRERYKATDIIGYADIVYSISTRKPWVHRLPKYSSAVFDCKDELHFPSYLKWQMAETEQRTIAFDAKSSIPSFGEIIRQLRTYKAFCDWSFYIVSPDARFESEISDEGFGFIKYPDLFITHPKKKANHLCRALEN